MVDLPFTITTENLHSIVFLAVCDAKYCFTLVDVGSYARENDAAIPSV